MENQLSLCRIAGRMVEFVCLASVVSLSACVSSDVNKSGNVREEGCEVELASKSTSELVPDSDVYVKAEFPGGNVALAKFLADNLVYPPVLIDGDVAGAVIVQFVIEKDGSVCDAEVVRSVHPDLDKEALRVVNLMPKWKPATLQEENVRSKFGLPIKFTLN